MQTINALGFPMYAMIQPGSLHLPNVTVTHQPKARKELGEIVKVKARPEQMPPEQQAQLEDHKRLMAVFQKSRLDLYSQNAVYTVVILGKSVREVAEASGLRAKTLAVAVSRMRGRM
jgi:hypothetical protein